MPDPRPVTDDRILDTTPPAGYVTTGAWTARPGRADHIDDVADGFERPVPAEAFWNAEPAVAWPRAPRGWRSADLFGGHRAPERRAG